MSYGFFIAIVLYPICRRLEKKGWPRSLAIGVSLSIVILLFLALLLLLVLELNSFRKDLPVILNKLDALLAHLQSWLQDNWHIGLAEQKTWWNNTFSKLTGSGNIISGTFVATGSMLFVLFMSPVFAVLLLYNRSSFVFFLEKTAGRGNNRSLHIILQQTIDTYYHFIKGMVKVYIVVGLLNSAGLLALGIPHAILFGMLTAVMTIIPYAGIFISSLLPITVAWISKDSAWYPLGVVMVFAVVQYLEANIIFPKIVAAQLNLSTWATLVAIIAGGLIWGVSGMILFIPFAGILKIVTDQLNPGAAINVLLKR